MAVCEKCWNDAYLRFHSDPSKSQSEHYRDLLDERKDSPCEKEFDGSVQFELDFGDRFIRVNCPDEHDEEIYVLVKRNNKYAGISLSLDEAEKLAKYIIGHVENARTANLK